MTCSIAICIQDSHPSARSSKTITLDKWVTIKKRPAVIALEYV